jgi:hypothetical protein
VGLPRRRRRTPSRRGVGFAYDLTGDGRTVVRGGVGKFYEYHLIGVRKDLTRIKMEAPSGFEPEMEVLQTGPGCLSC